MTNFGVLCIVQMDAKHNRADFRMQENPLINYERDKIMSKHGYYLPSVSKLPW